mmetsp:Transcript_60241/g.152464  ORF Transcript_60241/g.152464 Transcript_60241/m.152464 type:complete len:227 (+) Transcript_60241:505-1185(+)
MATRKVAHRFQDVACNVRTPTVVPNRSEAYVGRSGSHVGEEDRLGQLLWALHVGFHHWQHIRWRICVEHDRKNLREVANLRRPHVAWPGLGRQRGHSLEASSPDRNEVAHRCSNSNDGPLGDRRDGADEDKPNAACNSYQGALLTRQAVRPKVQVGADDYEVNTALAHLEEAREGQDNRLAPGAEANLHDLSDVPRRQAGATELRGRIEGAVHEQRGAARDAAGED